MVYPRQRPVRQVLPVLPSYSYLAGRVSTSSGQEDVVSSHLFELFMLSPL